MAKDSIQSVTGPIPGVQLGVTLAHEHLWCDISIQSGRPDNVLQDTAVAAEELGEFLRAGGGTVIELTPEGVGRNALKLKVISETSGARIVSGIAFYDEATSPEWALRAGTEEIAAYFVHEIEEGVEGVRAGLIGELYSHNEAQIRPDYRFTPQEEKVFRAAAAAQKRTGVAISTHAALGRPGVKQLDLLRESGADLSRVVIGHCDACLHEDPQRDFEYWLAILEQGAYCQFDMIGWTELADDGLRAQRLASLVEMGWEKKLLLSTDTCRQSQLRRNGGRGYGFLLTSFLPRLRALGITEPQIRSMLVDAPRAALAGG
ncbi:MAG: phosphotriesterase [Bryobacteraceae bacterium]